MVSAPGDDPAPRTTAVRRTAGVSLTSPTSSRPSALIHPEVVIWSQTNGAEEMVWEEINLRSLTADNVVGDCCDSQGEVATSSCPRGMSSYAPCTARGKPTERRRDNSPRRCYRGHPRRYLCYHGRPPDPRISPGQQIGEKSKVAATAKLKARTRGNTAAE